VNFMDKEIESIIKEYHEDEIVVTNKVQFVDTLMDNSSYGKPYTLDDRLNFSKASFNRVNGSKLTSVTILYLLLLIYFESQEILKDHC